MVQTLLGSLHVPAPVAITLFGPPQVHIGERLLVLARRQTRALLFRVAASAQPVPRDQLGFLLWPDTPEETARRLAKNARYTGELTLAKDLCERGLRLSQEWQIKRFCGMCLCNRAWIALAESEHEVSFALFSDGIQAYHAIGDAMGVVECLEGLTVLMAQVAQPASAAYLLGAAEQLRYTLHIPITPPELSAWSATAAAIKQRATTEPVAEVCAQGRRATVEELISVLAKL